MNKINNKANISTLAVGHSINLPMVGESTSQLLLVQMDFYSILIFDSIQMDAFTNVVSKPFILTNNLNLPVQLSQSTFKLI